MTSKLLEYIPEDLVKKQLLQLRNFHKIQMWCGVFIFQTVRMHSSTGALKTNFYFFKSFLSQTKLTNENNESISSALYK